MMQHLNYSRRGAGQKHIAAGHYRADILRMEAVNVLFGRDAADKLLGVDMLRHGKLAEYAADG